MNAPLRLEPGMRFGQLVVERRFNQTNAFKWRWLCLCDCGSSKAVIGSRLLNGKTSSCGCKMGFKGRDLSAFFWKHVEKTEGCWPWTAHRDRRGYGRMTAKGYPQLPGRRIWLATHVSWLIHHGALPSGLVLHRCDNPSCVRPDHLFLGTHADNVADMIAKGRGFWQK